MNLLITMTNSICNQGVDASANTSNSYWLTKAMEFHQNFIATGSPVVAASITNDTAHTLETLLNVSQCYDLYVKQQYNDIIVCMDNIGLIPKNCSEIAIKGEKYLHINEYLCSVMSDILILTTYAIKGLYELYIHESRGKISGGGMSQRSFNSNNDVVIENLKERCKAIFMFVEHIRVTRIRGGITKPDIISNIHSICHSLV